MRIQQSFCFPQEISPKPSIHLVWKSANYAIIIILRYCCQACLQGSKSYTLHTNSCMIWHWNSLLDNNNTSTIDSQVNTRNIWAQFIELNSEGAPTKINLMYFPLLWTIAKSKKVNINLLVTTLDRYLK